MIGWPSPDGPGKYLPKWKVRLILADMESSSAPLTPSEAKAAIAGAELARTRLATSLRLPSRFHSSLGAAIVVQIGAGAAGIARQDGRGLAVAVAGLLAFGLVAAVQLARFRRLNGAWIWGLVTQVLLGTATLTSTVYSAAFGAATWAAVAGAGWITPIAAVAEGAAYAWGGHRWWRAYQGAPAEHSPVGSTLVAVAAAGLAAALFLVGLVAFR